MGKKRGWHKYNDDIKEKAYALLTTNNNIREVARQLKIPLSTLIGWKKKFIQEDKEYNDTQGTNVNESNTNKFVQLRNEKKQEFITQAWGIVDKATKILEQRLDRALYSEQELDELVKQMRASNELSSEQVKELYRKMALIKIEDAGKLATIIGTMYDKQALANNEPTSKVDGSFRIEDMIKKVTGESDF